MSISNMAIERAWILAEIAHHGQTYGDGRPYMDHVREVHGRLNTELPDDAPYRNEILTVAILHDTIEDTPVTLYHIRKMVTGDPRVLVGLASITRVPGEDYKSYILRVSFDPTARVVKIADLKTNLANKPTKSLRERYEWALEMLEGPGHE